MNWIEIATRDAKDVFARILDSLKALRLNNPDLADYTAERIIRDTYRTAALHDILFARNLGEARSIALAVILATTHGSYSRYERTSTLRRAGLAFKDEHDRRSNEADQHHGNLALAIHGKGICGDWEEVAMVLLEERLVPLGSEAERFLLEELAGHVTRDGGPTDRVRGIMVERGFRFCQACDHIAEPVTACSCLDLTAAMPDDDYVLMLDGGFSPDAVQVWERSPSDGEQ